MNVGRFLAGVAALIWDAETERYLLLRRSAQKDFGARTWECVTGRVDQGEGFEEAVYREVKEELGVDAEIDFFLGTTHFYRGEAVPENELVGILCTCTITKPDEIAVSNEHSEWRWLAVDEVRAMLSPDNWLLRSIERAERIRSLSSPELREYLREQGLDIMGR
ncbi:MAG: NUDIX domain-containing protein [Caldilineales bacterium]|nr:NUDIX domain-containing protein [Caldilineales bacterium]